MRPLRRSVLYVPADNPRALTKSAQLPADVLIIDLEDAVAPDNKDAAREAARRTVAEDREVVLRINAPETPWHEGDVELARAAPFDAVVLPKVCDARAVMAISERTGLCVWPMLETARGILCAREIAEAAARTGPAALVLGTNDLSAELGVSGGDRAAIALSLQMAVLAAKAAQIDVIDGVANTLTDAEAVGSEAVAGRALGMTGKTVVHPAQIEPVNRAFSPSAAEIDRARAIVAAMASAAREGRSVATLDGRLIERLHADAAEQILAYAKAISAPSLQ